MKSMMFALAALAAFQAAAITATKEYVDRRDTEIRTNTYTKAETDARIVEISPAPDMSGVVHGDDRQADKTNFANGLRFRASDSDGGNMRFRVQDPMDNGISWYSDSSGTTFGDPFLRINRTGIRYPKDVEADEFGLLEWSDFTRTHTILDTMPAYSSSRQNYKFPISAGAFLDYFWNIQDLPSTAAAKFARTVPIKAASNLVDRAGALVNVEGIEERAAQLTATSTVPVYAFSDWSSDWPSDDEVQPLKPVWSNGTWSVKLKEVGGNWEYGPVSVAGAEDAVTFTVNIMGYATVFNRTATETGNFNAYGLARRSDITNIVNKAYVEGLGIESGVSAETATNIAEAVGANLPYLSEDGGSVYGAVNIDSDLTSISVTADYLDVNFDSYLKDTYISGILSLNDESVATEYYADTAAADAVASADTSYPRYMTITNLNQSVQFLNITNTEPSPLVIKMPTDGRTKDWIVYVYAATNVTLTLPSSMTYWMADVAYTNDVPPATPTAFYFSQISTNIFYLGRQELTEVTP